MTKWPAPLGPDVQIAVRRRQRRKDRRQPLDRIGLAADHHAVAVFQAPDATAGPRVDEAQALRGQLGGAADRIFVVGVAAVDDDIALVGERQQLLDGLIHRVARRHHEPDRPRQSKLFDEVGERMGADRALVDYPLNRLRAAIVADHPMAGAHQPLRHVSAHAAEPDHAQFHAFLLRRIVIADKLFAQRAEQTLQPSGRITAEIYPEHALAALFERRQIAQCLSLDQSVERVVGFRHG